MFPQLVRFETLFLNAVVEAREHPARLDPIVNDLVIRLRTFQHGQTNEALSPFEKTKHDTVKNSIRNIR